MQPPHGLLAPQWLVTWLWRLCREGPWTPTIADDQQVLVAAQEADRGGGVHVGDFNQAGPLRPVNKLKYLKAYHVQLLVCLMQQEWYAGTTFSVANKPVISR
jgi:hypothetical protein